MDVVAEIVRGRLGHMRKMARQGTREVESQEPGASSGFREMFRYGKAGRTRVYNLKVLSEDTTELWVVSIRDGNPVKSRKLVTFDSNEDVGPFLDDIERELRLGGWSRHR